MMLYISLLEAKSAFEKQNLAQNDRKMYPNFGNRVGVNPL